MMFIVFSCQQGISCGLEKAPQIISATACETQQHVVLLLNNLSLESNAADRSRPREAGAKTREGHLRESAVKVKNKA